MDEIIHSLHYEYQIVLFTVWTYPLLLSLYLNIYTQTHTDTRMPIMLQHHNNTAYPVTVAINIIVSVPNFNCPRTLWCMSVRQRRGPSSVRQSLGHSRTAAKTHKRGKRGHVEIYFKTKRRWHKRASRRILKYLFLMGGKAIALSSHQK